MLDALVRGPAGLGLEGDAGIGKTTLWRDVVTAARERGYTVLATAPAEPDAGLAFAGLGDLLDPVAPETLSALPGPQRAALEAALYLVDADRAPTDPDGLPRAVLSVIRRIAASAPLLVAVDDEQWLDRPTARVLAFALSRLRAEPVGALLARRSRSEGTLWPELVRGFGPGGLPTLELGPLDPGATHELLASRLGHAIARPQLRRLHEVSEGNPLYALAIARELDAGGRGEADEPVAIPSTLAEAVDRRLAHLDARTRDPLLVAAASPGPTISEIRATVPGFAPGDLDTAWSAGVIEIRADRIRFTHPLLASAVYAAAPPARRRELHRRLAAVVADPPSRARHLALGAEAPDAEIAAQLEQAAAEAARRGAPEVAAPLFEHASRLTPLETPQPQAARAIAAAEQHTVSGDIEQARAILEALLGTLPAGALRGRAKLRLARVCDDGFDAAAALAEDVVEEAAEDPRLLASAYDLLSELASNRGDRAAADRYAERGIQSAERTGDPAILARMLSNQALTRFFAGGGVQEPLLARAAVLERGPEAVSAYQQASTTLGLQRFWTDDVDAARPLLERAITIASEQGDEFGRSSLVFHLAHLEYEAGREPVAERHVADAVELSHQLADEQWICYVRWLQAYAAARHGELQPAREHADAAIAVAERIGDHFIASFAKAILAEIELRTGDSEAAHAMFRRLREGLVAGGTGFVGELTLQLWVGDIEALIALERLPEARAVLADLTGRPDFAANPNARAVAQRCRGWLTAAGGDVMTGIAGLDRALREHDRRPVPLEVARTLLELGVLQRRARRKAAAKASLERALALLGPLHAALWEQRARDELSRIGLRRASRADGLTQAQLRVAELAAAGRSNREIAAELFMSQRTVETHLTKIYRELNIKSRAQLGTALAARAEAAAR